MQHRTPEEEWRVIPSLPNWQASSFGRVMRTPHRTPMPKGGTRIRGGVPRTGWWDPVRLRFTHKIDGKTRRIGPLVCEAFHGPALDGTQCMHLNEDGSDNTPGNLAWGTAKENMNAPKLIEFLRQTCEARMSGEKICRADYQF